MPLGQHQALSSHLSLQVAIIGKERKGLGGEFGLPAWCQAQLRTHSRCFVSSCAIGVHIFHLFFPSSSDLSLKTQGRVALLRAGVSCPAQKPLNSPKTSILSTKLLLCYRRRTDPSSLLPPPREL